MTSTDDADKTTMPRWQRVYLIACAWVIGFCVAYAAAQWGEWPKLTYFPLLRKWEMWSTPPGPLPMPYVGLLLWGLGGGIIGAAIASVVVGRLRPLSDRIIRLIGAWALSAFVVTGLFYTWNLWPF